MDVCILSFFWLVDVFLPFFNQTNRKSKKWDSKYIISSFICLDDVEKRGNVLFYSRSNQILLFCMIMYTYSAVE